jgi:hypothetical protein
MAEPECPNGDIECNEHFKSKESLERNRIWTSIIYFNPL